jgi:hypothetical protein
MAGVTRLLTGVLLFSTWIAAPLAGAETWRQNTFDDFRQGRSDDGGVNLYAAADGTVRTIYTWDYNRDGANDILFVCGHNNNHAPPAYVYMNDKTGFDLRFRWLLLSDGAYGGTLADLNGDGWPDAVLCGTSNGMNYTALDAIVYYGGEQGYAKRRSVRLPTFQSRSATAIDFDGDGRPDLVFAQGRKPGAIIYFNGKDGFDPCRHETIDCESVSCCRTADVNGDGREDLVLLAGSRILVFAATAQGIRRDAPQTVDVRGSGRFAVGDCDADGHADLVVTNDNEKGDAWIHWGDGKGGFSARPPTPLPSLSSQDVAIADLNKDGRSDIVLANLGRDNATGDAPTTIFWGSVGGFDKGNKQDLQTRFADGLAVADLDGDGWPDLVIACKRTAQSFNTDSYVYWNRNGRFTEKDRTALPTLGAVAAAVADVDRNGRPDILFLNGTDGTVGLMDSRIYWNDGKGRFSTERMTLIPTKDPFGHFAADLNLDGQLDMVFCGSYEYGRFRDEGSQLYWGHDGTWSPDRLSLIPTRFATGIVTGDLNKDGWLDLVCAQIPAAGNPSLKEKNNTSPILWGSKDGFSKDRATWLKVENPRGLTVADLNKDGWLDIIYTNLSYETLPIYWGSPDGYANDRKTDLPIPNKGSVCVDCADVNSDGWLDLLVVCFYDCRDPDHLTTDRNSYVFLGSPNGFDSSRRIDLPTMGGDQPTIADFDKDGRLDIFIGNYDNGYKERTWSSYLYSNGPDGFSPARRTGLFTNSGSGSIALDFNGDGWLDLAVACHKMPNGDHRANSFVFFGGPDGFSDYRKIELPTNGAHETTFIDAGHIYHRRFEIAYTSGVHDAGRPAAVGLVSWKADTPHGSRLCLQLRCADDPSRLEQSPWVGAAGPGTFFETPGAAPRGALRGRFIQYRAAFFSSDGSNYPILREVSVECPIERE